jgi:uncharacterized coiled-coil protein SlyX
MSKPQWELHMSAEAFIEIQDEAIEMQDKRIAELEAEVARKDEALQAIISRIEALWHEVDEDLEVRVQSIMDIARAALPNTDQD